jgi:hypothetical protein
MAIVHVGLIFASCGVVIGALGMRRAAFAVAIAAAPSAAPSAPPPLYRFVAIGAVFVMLFEACVLCGSLSFEIILVCRAGIAVLIAMRLLIGD